MFNLYPMPITPDRALDPPDAIVRQDHDWACVFRCWIGDGEQQVKVICTVTRADEIDPDSIEAYLEPKITNHCHDIDVSKMLNAEIRRQITSHFERNFDEIHYSNHQ